MTKKEFINERTRIISEMLDNPDKYGIYPTTKCFIALDELFDRIQKEACENPYLYDFKTGNELSFEEAEKMGWHIPTKIDMEQIEETQNKITEEFVKMRDSDLNGQFDYRDRDYFQRGYNLGITSQKGSPTAYEWHNLETGHCYVDYIPHFGEDEKDGFYK